MATFEDNVPPPFISPNLCYVSGPLLDKFLKPGKCVGRYTEITVQTTAYQHTPVFWHIRIALRHQVSPRRLHIYGSRFCKLRLKLCNAIFMSTGFYWKENIMCIRYPLFYQIKMRHKLLKQEFLVIKVEAFPLCALKAYVGSRATCIAPLFLSLGARWR